MEQNVIQYNWEALPLEERKRRVGIRMKNLGMFKDVIIVKNPKLHGVDA